MRNTFWENRLRKTLWETYCDKNVVRKKRYEIDVVGKTWENRFEKDVMRETLWERRCEKIILRKTLWERRCEKDVVRKTLWKRRCEKDVGRNSLWERYCEKNCERDHNKYPLIFIICCRSCDFQDMNIVFLFFPSLIILQWYIVEVHGDPRSLIF